MIPAKSFSAYRIQTKYKWKEKVKIKLHHIHLSQFNSKLSSQMVLYRVEGRGGIWGEIRETNKGEVGRRWFSYLFQCSLLLYKAGNMIGRIVDALSLIRLRMYSLFQKYRARSATCWLSYTKKKKIVKNPKQEHLRNQSISKQSYKRNTRQKKFWLVQQLVKEKTKLCLVTRYIYNGLLQKKKKKVTRC